MAITEAFFVLFLKLFALGFFYVDLQCLLMTEAVALAVA